MVELVTFGDVGGMVGYILASRKPPQQTRTFRYGPVVFGEKVIRSGEQPWQNVSVRVETNIGPAPPRDFEYLPCQVLSIVPGPNTAEAVRENSVGVALIERRKAVPSPAAAAAQRSASVAMRPTISYLWIGSANLETVSEVVRNGNRSRRIEVRNEEGVS